MTPENTPPLETSTFSSARKKRRAPSIVGIVAAALVALVILVVVGFNVYTRVTYSAFYFAAQEEFEIPGIHAGFICQDLDFYDEGNCWFFSGYATGDGASPLYRRAADGSATEFFAALPDGSSYTDHGSAITTTGNFAFLACEDGYLVFDAAEFAAAEPGDVVRAIDRVSIGISPAFMNIENDTLFAGTFHLEPNYVAPEHHHMVTPDGAAHAGIMFAFPANEQEKYGFASEPTHVYSLPDKVQGVCQLPNGDFVLSVSYGFASSYLQVFRLPETDASEPNSASSANEASKGGAKANLARHDANGHNAYETPGHHKEHGGAYGSSGSDNANRDEGNKSNIPSDAADTYTFMVKGKSVPLSFLERSCLVAEISAPPMTEGIEYHDGRVYISEESASNKYIFGKLYGAGDVFSIPESALLK